VEQNSQRCVIAPGIGGVWSPTQRGWEVLASRTPRVLIVEDQIMLGMQLAAAVQDCGCEPVGPAGLVVTALPMALREPLDAALLDVYLIDQTVAPVAEVLARRGIPFAFVTAYSRHHLPEALQSRRCLHKPFTDQEIRSLVTALTGAAARSATMTP
jgi:DNA-binding response OmpR family regulator